MGRFPILRPRRKLRIQLRKPFCLGAALSLIRGAHILASARLFGTSDGKKRVQEQCGK
jgi:hypothetical protein